MKSKKKTRVLAFLVAVLKLILANMENVRNLTRYFEVDDEEQNMTKRSQAVSW